MSVLARNRIITIVEATTPDASFDPGVRFRCVQDGSGAIESVAVAVSGGAVREFSLQSSGPRPWTTAYVSSPTWFQELHLFLGYSYAAGSDLEYLERMMDADVRSLIQRLADPNNWNGSTDEIDSIEFGEAPNEDIIVGEDEESSVGVIRAIPFSLIHT